MGFNIDPVNSSQFFNELKELVNGFGNVESNRSDVNKKFLKARIESLNMYIEELEDKQSEIESQLVEEIQEIMVSKGAEILMIKQTLKLAIKECGVCECNLQELNEASGEMGIE